MVTGVELDEDSKPSFCESCKWGKKHRKPIQRVREEPKGSAEYSVSFTDGYASHTRVYLIRTKDETFDQYQAYEAWLKTQYGVTIKVFHSDQGGEFMSDEFSKHLHKAGTIHWLCTTPPNIMALQNSSTELQSKRFGPSYTKADCQNFCGERHFSMLCT